MPSTISVKPGISCLSPTSNVKIEPTALRDGATVAARARVPAAPWREGYRRGDVRDTVPWRPSWREGLHRGDATRTMRADSGAHPSAAFARCTGAARRGRQRARACS
eukprot:4224584-Prymnesium_polylepis.1